MRAIISGTALSRAGVVALVMMFALAACAETPPASPGGATPAEVPATESPRDDATGSPGGQPAVSPPGTEQASLKVGIPQLILSFLPLYIADSHGYWEEENLDVELIFFASGSEAQQAILGDAVDIGAGGYTEPIIVEAQGVDTRLFGFIQDTLPYHLMVNPEITSIEELEGKTLGVSREGALSDQVTRIALAKLGFDPSLANYQAVGGSPSRLAALEAGAIDGTILDAPSYLLAEEAGFVSLVDYTQELTGFPYEVLYAKTETMEQNRDVFLRFMRGYIKGARFATDPANREEVISIAAEYLEAEEEDVALGYDIYIGDFPPDGAPTMEGTEQALEGTAQYADIPGIENITPDDLYYAELVEEAVQSLEAYP